MENLLSKYCSSIAMAKKRVVILSAAVILLLLVLLGAFYLAKNATKTLTQDECDDKGYIQQVIFGEEDISLVGNFNPSAVYNEDNSLAYYPEGDAKLKIGQTLTIYLTEECTSRFELTSLTDEKAVIKHEEACAPPGPSERKECFFEIKHVEIY
jgi:hypothetical protein